MGGIARGAIVSIIGVLELLKRLISYAFSTGYGTYFLPIGVVCTGLYKLSPLYALDQDTFNDIKSPSEVMKFEEGESCQADVNG